MEKINQGISPEEFEKKYEKSLGMGVDDVVSEAEAKIKSKIDEMEIEDSAKEMLLSKLPDKIFVKRRGQEEVWKSKMKALVEGGGDVEGYKEELAKGLSETILRELVEEEG